MNTNEKGGADLAQLAAMRTSGYSPQDAAPATTTNVIQTGSPNVKPPFLRLPPELQYEIGLLLAPRDALALSITCRQLHTGILSAKNRYFWYRVGRFGVEIPGYRPEWTLLIGLWHLWGLRHRKNGNQTATQTPKTVTQTPKTADRSSIMARVSSLNFYDDPTLGSNPVYPSELIQAWIDFTSRECCRCRPTSELEWVDEIYNAIRKYEPDFYVNYNKLLWDTLCGETLLGCQWCLQCPDTLQRELGVCRVWNNGAFETRLDSPVVARRYCPECSWKNFVSADVAVQLGIDLSGLFSFQPAEICRDRYDPHGLFFWKPSLERRITQRYGENISFCTAFKTGQTEAAAYRERHFAAIFQGIKNRYRKLSSRRGSGRSGADGLDLRGLEKIITAEDLQPEWFFVSGPKGDSWEDLQTWKYYCKRDSLWKQVSYPAAGELWKKEEWVERHVQRKLDKMVMLFGGSYQPKDWAYYYVQDIPTNNMIEAVTSIAVDWHLKRAEAAGVDNLMQKTLRENGGIECPWAFTGTECNQCRYTDVREFLEHLGTHSWSVLIRGDTDWLTGKPSIWWPADLPIQLIFPDGSRELAHYQPAVEQENWLWKWWPGKWQEGYRLQLKKWHQDGAFFEIDETTGDEPEEELDIDEYGIWGGNRYEMQEFKKSAETRRKKEEAYYW